MDMLLFRIKINAIFTENGNSGFYISETFFKEKKVKNTQLSKLIRILKKVASKVQVLDYE